MLQEAKEDDLMVQRAKREGRYKGRKEDTVLHSKISGLLIDSKSYVYIESLLKCSRHTIFKVKKRLPQG